MNTVKGKITEDGATVELLITQGKAAPIYARAVIDTGTERTLIHRGWLPNNGYKAANGMTLYAVTSHKSEERLYTVGIEIINHNPPTGHPREITALEADLHPKPNGIMVALGRDILDHCKLTYDGPNTTFTLEW
jgi:hypothetical protein